MLIFFELVKVDGVTWNAGIRDGDQLIEIAGGIIYLTTACKLRQYLTNLNRVNMLIINTREMEKFITTKVYVKKLIQFDWLAGSLSALFWMLIGFIVLTAKPDGRIHRIILFSWCYISFNIV